MTDQTNLIAHTTAIVSAYLGRNQLIAGDLPQLIKAVYDAMSTVGAAADAVAPEGALTPAVPIRRSVTDDFIICLEDGARLKLLKPYLQSRFGLTPAQYRRKWKLPDDYPMVAPRTARRRSDIAKTIGLGNHRQRSPLDP